VLVAPATATGATWRDALGATAADVRNASAADLKRRLDAPVRPLVDAPLTAADLDAVKADAETYPDGDRPRSRAEGEAMLAQAAVASLGFRLSSEGAARSHRPTLSLMPRSNVLRPAGSWGDLAASPR